MHVGAFVLAWSAGSVFLAAILSPHWVEAVNSQSEAVASLRMSQGLLERCTYLPTGQIECYPIYNHNSQWAGAMKGLMFAAFALMVASSFAILAGGNCTGIGWKEHAPVQSGKGSALLAAGLVAIVALVLSMVTLILMTIQISEKAIFASSMISSISGNDGISETYDLIIYKGSSFILASIGCALSGVVGILGVISWNNGRKAAVDDFSPDYPQLNPYEDEFKPNARDPLIEPTAIGANDYI